MRQFIADHHEANPPQRAEEDRGTGASAPQTGAAPHVDPREETLLGILLRLPATWIR
jgi:hypothetical protein